MIDIWEPRWHDKVVLIAKYKVRSGQNIIRFTKGSMKGKTYTVDSATIRDFPLETNGKIQCYAVPLAELIEETELWTL